MNVLKLIKLLIISAAVFLASSFLVTNSAYARNITGGFGAGTRIATPDGDVSIEELKPGDRAIGYNFETHHTAENIVKEIEQKTSLSYYLINNKTKITGTSFVYIKTKDNPKLITVQQLKLQARLFSQNHSSIITNSVKQIVQPTNIYQVVFENQEGNLFADNLLIHNGNKIPALFEKQYLMCDYGEVGTINYTRCVKLNSDSLPGFIKALAILLFGIILLGTIIAKLLIYIRNLIRFSGKQFTDNAELINFTTSINPNFTNRYSTKYYDGIKVWCLIPLQPEIDETEYQHLIEKRELIEQIDYLYTQYQQDLVNKNFSDIVRYFDNFANKYKNYQKYFTDKFDIIYQAKIINVAILDFYTETNNFVFKVQIDAEMINFVVSQAGYVLTGDSKIQQYSEYWHIELTTDRQCCIKDINDTLTTRIMQGDKKARREVYANTGA